MDIKLILRAAKEIKNTYINPVYSNKSTQWTDRVIYLSNQPIQCISIAGTNGVVDWLWNMALASWGGVKLASYYSAKRIKKTVIKHDIPLLICGHSKSGPTAMYLGKLLNADYRIAFNPAPGFRRKEKLKNTLGETSFGTWVAPLNLKKIVYYEK